MTSDTTAQNNTLKKMPQPAEWIVQGQRPHGKLKSKKAAIDPPMDSVRTTATRPTQSPSVAADREIHGNQHTPASTGHS